MSELAWRETHRGRVWRIFACRLVAEQDGLLALWHPAGAPGFRPFVDGREARIPGEADWTLEPSPAGSEGLGLVRPGERHSLWLHWRAGVFEHWYVNFERDHVRTPVSLDVVDEKLDLVVPLDGRWRLKDVDEFEEAAHAGYLEPAPVLEEAQRLLRKPPWPTGLEEWRPDPLWPAPGLPEGWDVV